LHFLKKCDKLNKHLWFRAYLDARRARKLEEVKAMKQGIHPKYESTTIQCACGEVIETRSTKKDIRVDICSKCHPFFTGKQKLVDTGGRVDRFNKKFNLGK